MFDVAIGSIVLDIDEGCLRTAIENPILLPQAFCAAASAEAHVQLRRFAGAAPASPRQPACAALRTRIAGAIAALASGLTDACD